MSTSDRIKHSGRDKPFSCEEVNRFIIRFLEDQVDQATHIQFEAHLRHCPNCETFLDQYRETIHLAKHSEHIELPEELVNRTIEFLRKHYDDEA